MNHRPLGHSGLRVSPLCLGTMMFADRTDEAEAAKIVALAREAGVNFIDTADVYSRGGAEAMVGRLIEADRHDWVLASKVGNPMSDKPNETGLGRKWMLRAIDESLGRLGTDHLDIYYLHLPDPATPMEETLSALDAIVSAGKARYWGVSNFRAWQIAELVNLAAGMGLDPPVVCQPYYNAMNRQPEVEVLPVCDHHGLGVVPYSPLARGVLTGKYTPGAAPPEGTRAGRGNKRILESEFREESLEIAQKIRARAEAQGMTAGQWALNWVLANPIVSAAIAGPRTAAQWQENLGALEHDWDPENETFLDALVAPGHPSTPGYSDPSYPLIGRPVAKA
ncbi:MAG: aldo/keto reductase [Rhodospirillales bacterium]|nr:aldo/keto reductase [Rhodospirillales bacterium]